MEKVPAYKCSFCKPSSPSLFLSRSGVKKHEERCWLNPARRSCATCANLASVGEVDTGWKCLKGICTPFKEKVENCPHYESSGDIFDNGCED